MPFPTKERAFQLRAQGNKCQTMIYTEAQGYHICGSTKDLELDHLYPESQLIVEGQLDPNHSPGIVRCQRHHTGFGIVYEHGVKQIAPAGSPEWSRHPDMGQALISYRNGDKDAFKNAAKKHVVAAERGLRITNDDVRFTESEVARVQEMNVRHVITTGERVPVVRNHGKFTLKHWSDIFFGTRSHKEDEG